MEHHKSWLSVLLTFSLFLFFGCSNSMSLRYEKPFIGSTMLGKIGVSIKDMRAPEKGGTDPIRVGTMRSAVGIPYSLRASKDPVKVVKELVSDCLKANGYEVVDPSPNIPQLNVTLKSFWCDGYQVNRAWMQIQTELKAQESSVPVWQDDFESSVNVVMTVGYGAFDKGFNRMLEDAKQKLFERFKDSEFNNAFKSI
jgi:hypothetical protein